MAKKFPLKQGIGWFISVGIGIPLVAGAVVATALVHAFMSQKTIPSLAESFYKNSPMIARETYAITANPGVIKDNVVKTWQTAFAQMPEDPISFLEKNGFFIYLETETKAVGEQLVALTKKEVSGTPQVTIDAKPVKQLVSSPSVATYIKEVMDHLPPCQEKENAAWEFFLANNFEATLPGCRPPDQMVTSLLNAIALYGDSLPDTLSILPPASLYALAASLMIALTTLWVIALLALAIGAMLITESFSIRSRLFGIGLMIPTLLAAGITYMVNGIPGQASLIVYLLLPADTTINWTPELKPHIGIKIIELCTALLQAVTPSLYGTAIIVASVGMLCCIVSFAIKKSGMLKE